MGIEGFFEAKEVVGAVVDDGILVSVAGFGVVGGRTAEKEGGDVEAGVVMGSVEA